MHAKMSVDVYVGALLGVWGIIPFFCVPDWLMDAIVVVVFVAGWGVV